MAQEITIEELERNTSPKRVIDIRSREAFEKGAFPFAENIPLEELKPEIIAADTTMPVYLFCHTGRLSMDVADDLEDLGCEAYSVKGGYHSYLKRQLKRMMANGEEMAARRERAERSIIKKFRKQLWTPFIKALKEYHLIEDGDRIAVCISGGKDSMLMAKLFQELLRHGKRNFEAVFLVMNPGYNELNYSAVVENAKLLGIPIEVFRTEIFDIVAEQSDSPCYLCARMRRGSLYSKAKDLGCNKIALGHHYDDVIETILMGMLYGAQIQTMMPKLHSTNSADREKHLPERGKCKSGYGDCVQAGPYPASFFGQLCIGTVLLFLSPCFIKTEGQKQKDRPHNHETNSLTSRIHVST